MRRSAEIDRRAAALYAAGLGLAEVGRFVGLSAPTVHRILRERGVPRRARGRRWEPRPSAAGRKKIPPDEKRALPLAG
jgi:hypothetical protein